MIGLFIFNLSLLILSFRYPPLNTYIANGLVLRRVGVMRALGDLLGGEAGAAGLLDHFGLHDRGAFALLAVALLLRGSAGGGLAQAALARLAQTGVRLAAAGRRLRAAGAGRLLGAGLRAGLRGRLGARLKE